MEVLGSSTRQSSDMKTGNQDTNVACYLWLILCEYQPEVAQLATAMQNATLASMIYRPVLLFLNTLPGMIKQGRAG